MFSNTLIQSLIDLFTDKVDLDNSYIMDNCHELNLSILNNSKNIIYFRNCIVSEEDVELNKAYFEHSKNKKLYILTVFLNPLIVTTLNEKYPNLTFFTIYNSSLLNSNNRNKILKDEDIEYSYNSGFMGSDYMSKLFRKLIFNFFDDI
jgi:hypothetical protein